MTDAVYFLDSPGGALAAGMAGGKGANLMRLVAGGFKVPPGFVVPAPVAQLLDGRPPGDWPAGIADAITAAARELCRDGGRLAVRSSATDEDGSGASFAGQHKTVLDVRPEDVLDAVARCIASLHSDAARAYRQHGSDDRDATDTTMAVVVQLMVEGDASGVAFSIDPVAGDRDHLVIEAVAGRGEGLVSGQVEADRYRLSRATLAVVAQHVTGEYPVLDAERVREIGQAVLAVEEQFGTPQDIEFTVQAGALWLLQARPITTTGERQAVTCWESEFDSPADDRKLYTSANIQEVLPGVLTPLTITTFAITGYEAYTRDYQEMHLLDRDEEPEFVAFFYNRAFLNISGVRLIADRTLFTNGDAIETSYFGGVALGGQPESLSRRLKHTVLSTPILLRTWLHADRDVAHMERQVLEVERRLRAADLAIWTDAALEELRQRTIRFGARMFRTHLRVTGAAGGLFEQLRTTVRAVLGDETDGTMPTLLGGMREIESAHLSIGLWELSRVAWKAGLADALRARDFDAMAPEHPATWRGALRDFLARHGHRGLNEMDAASTPWRADPAALMPIVASYADLDDAQSPALTLERQAERRLTLTATLAARMNPVRRAVFRWQLGQTQRLVVLRERAKSAGVRAARFGDFFVPEMTRRLMAQGVIAEPADLFFLTYDEVDALFHGGREGDYGPRITRRRAEYARNRHVRLPEHFHGRPQPLAPDLAKHDGERLHGTPVSPGQVIGRARVILDAGTDGHMEPGEILVAPVTDAGWTPLFAIASGLVVDMGSALSHGSTVAREYGLPAVVNVRHGTTRIRTGDLIAVDGNAGTVAILEPAAPDGAAP